MTRDKHGKVDHAHKAWRPFWRNEHWHNAPAQQKYYWHPGETVAMSLHVVASNKLRLTISDLGDKPRRKFTTTLDASGFGTKRDTFFKRVDAIDQSGTEGKHVRHSASHINGTTWSETTLITAGGGDQAMMPGFRKVIDDPPAHVKIVSTRQQRLHGGESIAINASKKKAH